MVFFLLEGITGVRSSEMNQTSSSSTSYSEEQVLLGSLINDNHEIFSLEEIPITNDDIIELDDPQKPLITDSLENLWKKLPEEMFFQIFLFCEKSELINCALVSQQFKSLVRRIIPGFIKLPVNPSWRQIITMLRSVEKFEENHIPLSTEYGNLYSIYFNELQRLAGFEEAVRYSPCFWICQGGNRINKILDKHQISKPQDLWDFPCRFYASMRRDPCVIPMAISMMVSGTYILGGIISNKLEVYRASVDLHDNFFTKPEYKEAYAKNLLYAQSDAFINKYVNVNDKKYHNVKVFYDVDIGARLNENFPDYSCSRGFMLQPNVIINETLFCQATNFTEVLNTLPDSQYGGMFMDNLNVLFGSSFSLQHIENYFEKISNFICNRRLNNWFVQNSETQNVFIATYKCDDQKSCYKPLAKDMIKFHVNRIDYNVSCIAHYSSKVPDSLHNPVGDVTLGSLLISISWLIYVFLFWKWFIIF